MDIGTRIKQLRKSRGLTAASLAEKVNVTREHLSAVENNIKTISLSTLQKICDAMDISLAEFLSTDDKNLSPDYFEIMQNLKELSPKQLKVLNEFLKAFK